MTPGVSHADLRTLFLFERLTDEQLDWLAAHGRVESVPAGGSVFVEGEPATCFFVLLNGTFSMTRRVAGDEVEVVRTTQRGAYSGATQAYLGERVDQIYLASGVAVTDCTFLALPADEFGAALREWFPMAMHLLEGVTFGMRTSEHIVNQRERLLALGSLTAGLTHELNNPAAAAVRATSALRERVAGMRHKLALLASADIDHDQLRMLTELQEAAVERAAKAPKLSPLQVSDAEDEFADWLDDRGISGAMSLAPIFVAAGFGIDWAAEIEATVGDGLRDSAFRWLAYSLETEALMTEIEDATTRVSTLIGAAKQYSQLDRTPYQLIDVHDGLVSTLVMLTGKLRGVHVVKEFDRELPRIPAYAAELNQVWTNIIDNAVGAMAGSGTLTLRTSRDGDALVVEIADTGPGIPPALQERIFEPFFTTKPVGEGTGLGLDISFRIVVNRHHGDLRVRSEPGDTRFSVRLPLQPPAPSTE